MHVRDITLFAIRLPLAREIRHASAARSESENLVARCRLADGTEGWGEGVPRDYVTGETIDGAFKQFSVADLPRQLADECASLDDAIALCHRLHLPPPHDDSRGCYGNALRCALELSVLDAWSRRLGRPLSAVTQCFAPARKIATSLAAVRYSTTITVEGPRSERLSALKMRLYDFQQCKVKVGSAGCDDTERLRRIRRWLGRSIDVRLDANEAWPAEEVVKRVEPLLPFGIGCLEQPVRHEEIAALAEIRRRLPVPIMLDESLTSMADAETAIRLGACDLFNVRLSKCGGFLASLRLAARARQAGLGYQLGCHPGETGILSAAGRHWATSVSGIRYLEGSYDRHLLRELPTNEDITFGYGGRAPALRGPGLGVTINMAVFEKLVTRRETISL